MARIRATQEFQLENRYGGIWWNYENGNIYGVLERETIESATERRCYNLTDGSEELVVNTIDFDHYELTADSPVRSAQFWSGEIGLLVDKQEEHTVPYTGRFQMVFQTIYWWQNSGTPAPGENRFWDGIGAFTLRHEDGVRTFFFQGPAQGNIVRWNIDESSEHDPGKTHQYLPWRAEGGEVRAMDFWNTGSSEADIQTPNEILILANHGGRIAFMDVSEWDAENLKMAFYKSFSCAEARDISDICIDRENNILWVLDSGNKLLKYDLEPFGTEETDYENTPHSCRLEVSARTVERGSEITISGKFFDMWDQIIEIADLPVDIVSGAAMGTFGDSFRIRVSTDSDGIFQATYKAGSETGVDEIVARYAGNG